jgi:carbon-monoxide dehydrogenase medium subunit
MYPNSFEYFCPQSLPEAIQLLSTYQDDAKVLAGGQSLLSVLKLRLASPKCLVDINRIQGLAYIREEKDGAVAIGAMTRYADLRDSKLLQDLCPILPQAASVVGDVQVRNRGTIGGSIAHADPAGDVPAAVLALQGELKAVGPKGERKLNAQDFFLGMYATALAPDEILTEIRVPVLKNRKKSAYLKAARRPSDFAIVGVAACFALAPNGTCNDIAIGVTGVTDKPYRATAVESKLKGTNLDAAAVAAAAPAITDGVDVIENIHASKDFRAHLARVYLSRVLQAAR